MESIYLGNEIINSLIAVPLITDLYMIYRSDHEVHVCQWYVTDLTLNVLPSKLTKRKNLASVEPFRNPSFIVKLPQCTQWTNMNLLYLYTTPGQNPGICFFLICLHFTRWFNGYCQRSN